MKNFTVVWISGPANHKLSKVSDHAWSDQHKLQFVSMSLMRADEAKAMKKPAFCMHQLQSAYSSWPSYLRKKWAIALICVTLLPKKTGHFENIQQFMSWRCSMSVDGVDKGAEERPSSDPIKWDSLFNLSDDSEFHTSVELEAPIILFLFGSHQC